MARRGGEGEAAKNPRIDVVRRHDYPNPSGDLRKSARDNFSDIYVCSVNLKPAVVVIILLDRPRNGRKMNRFKTAFTENINNYRDSSAIPCVVVSFNESIRARARVDQSPRLFDGKIGRVRLNY